MEYEDEVELPKTHEELREEALKFREEKDAVRTWSIYLLRQDISRAVNNGHFSYRDLAELLVELYDDDEREALKKLL